MADCTNIKKGSFRSWINQDVQIAGIRVATMNDRAKNTWISRSVRFHDKSNGFPMRLQNLRRFHVDVFNPCLKLEIG